MKLINKIKKNLKIKKLKKETNDFTFINQVKILKNNIGKYNQTITKYETKIEEHYNKIKEMFLNKNTNTEKELETKKMAFNYHLYLLKKYCEELYQNSLTEKLSY